MYVHDSLKGYLPSVLTNNFDYLHEIHNYNTRTSALYCVKLPISRTFLYGIDSVKGQSARAWNYLQTNCSADFFFFFFFMHFFSQVRNIPERIILISTTGLR